MFSILRPYRHELSIISPRSARLLGPFSKRREVNIRKKYYRKEQIPKVLPPFEITGELPDGLVYEPMPDGHRVTDIEAMVASALPYETRHERKLRLGDANPVKSMKDQMRLPSRWLRRRYRQLLAAVR